MKMRTKQQIYEQIDRAAASSTMSGMSYEEGVRAALEWVTGESNEEPMEE